MNTKNIHMREATVKDVASLTSFATKTWTIAFGESLSEDEIKHHTETYLSTDAITTYITNDVVLVAEEDGVIVGYIHLSALSLDVDTPKQQSKSLRRLYVHPEYQGRGIGSQLIESALEHPFLATTRYIYLDVWEKNLGAIRLYERHGFRRYGEMRFYHADGTAGDLDYIMQFDRKRQNKEIN